MTAPRRIFILDDMPERHERLRLLHYRKDIVVSAFDYGQAVSIITSEPQFDIWQLDHDLSYRQVRYFLEGKQPPADEKNGNDFLSWAIRDCPKELEPKEVIVHTHNTTAGPAMTSRLRGAGFKAGWQLAGESVFEEHFDMNWAARK